MCEGTGQESTNKVDKSEDSIKEKFSTTKGVEDSGQTCSNQMVVSSEGVKLKPKKHYYELAIGFNISQYNITGRKMKLDVPIRPNPDLKKMDDFHKLSGSGFQFKETHDVLPSMQKQYPDGGDAQAPAGFLMYLANSSRLITEDGFKNGYEDEQSQQAYLNDFLGKAIAIQLSRTKTLETQGNVGDWRMTFLKDAGDTFHVTEKMCVKLYAFLKTKLHGKEAIYNIENGKIGSEISEVDYNKAKRIDSPVHNDPEGKKMRYIPGVQQIHILINSPDEAVFYVEEIHCDGDCIYPDP